MSNDIDRGEFARAAERAKRRGVVRLAVRRAEHALAEGGTVDPRPLADAVRELLDGDERAS
jgi:hypothetical protein